MTIKFSSLVARASLLIFCSVSAAAFADGMPFAETKPKPNLTPIDKAMETPPAKTQEQPVNVTPAPEAAAPAPLKTAEPTPPVPESRIVDVQPNTSFFGLSVGTYDRFTHAERATSFSAEWQPGVKIAGRLQPLFGAMVTTKRSLLGYGGIGLPINVTDHVFLMPSVAIGAYKEGDGYDLGRTLVYRAGTELAYQFSDKSRLGLNVHMLTNGTSLHRPDRTEIIGITYTMPLSTLSGFNGHMNAQASPPAAPLAVPVASADTTETTPSP